MAAGGDMSHLIQHAQRLQREMKQVQEELKKRIVSGEAGGGQVKVFFNGQQEALKIEIDPQVVDPADLGLLEDLLLIAMKSGLEKSKTLSQEEMGRLTGGVNIPGLF
ncbi:MAG: YbaB/EbfC family nucleoid-associated protein [Planctomycetota bacterium]